MARTGGQCVGSSDRLKLDSRFRRWPTRVAIGAAAFALLEKEEQEEEEALTADNWSVTSDHSNDSGRADSQSDRPRQSM